MSGPRAKKWPKVNRGLKIVNYFTCMRHFSCRWYRPPEVDLNGYPRISNPYCSDIQIWTYEWTQGKKWPKVNRGLKIVYYFTCMRHFSCRWYRPPEVDLNGYPRISNPYCHDIQIRRCEWTQGKKWPKVNRGLKIVNYFTCMRHFSCRWYRPPEVDLNGYPRISNPYCSDIQIRTCEWTQGKKWPKVNRGLKIVNYFTCMRHFSCRWYRPPEVDLNGYPRISNPYCHDIQIRTYEWTQGKKWPKVNRGLKIVYYFTCMRHFSCRWYRPPEVDLNGYPRISNPYCRDIQIRTYEWTQGKKMTQSKSRIKNSKLFYMYAALLL